MYRWLRHKSRAQLVSLLVSASAFFSFREGIWQICVLSTKTIGVAFIHEQLRILARTYKQLFIGRMTHSLSFVPINQNVTGVWQRRYCYISYVFWKSWRWMPPTQGLRPDRYDSFFGNLDKACPDLFGMPTCVVLLFGLSVFFWLACPVRLQLMLRERTLGGTPL